MVGWCRLPGLSSYRDTLRLQTTLVGARQQQQIQDVVLAVEHRPVYTAGRRLAGFSKTLEAENLRRVADVEDVDRGGLLTFHGPGQLVIYPILSLGSYVPSMRWYVGMLQSVMERSFAKMGVPDVARRSDHIG